MTYSHRDLPQSEGLLTRWISSFKQRRRRTRRPLLPIAPTPAFGIPIVPQREVIHMGDPRISQVYDLIRRGEYYVSHRLPNGAYVIRRTKKP